LTTDKNKYTVGVNKMTALEKYTMQFSQCEIM